MGNRQRDLRYPVCPVCGQECEKVYRDVRTLEILGCDVCVEEKDACGQSDCFPDDE